jgi:hemoglobin/transferrin/lactoferrin receptor protein
MTACEMRPVILLAFLSALPGMVQAQSNDVARLPEVVVTATREESPPFEVPYTVTTVPLDGARTVPEAFHETPAVMVQKTAHGQGSPYIRGFTGFRTLFLIDGIRLNNSTFREGPNQYWNTVDSFSVGRLELVKGPSSVLYGSDAVGGTVNALTLAAPDEWTGRAYYRFASAEDSHTGRVEGGGASGPFHFVTGVSVKSYGDLNDFPKTGYDEWDLDLKAEYRLTDDRQLVAAWQHIRQDDIWRTHRTIYGTSFAGTAIGTDRAAVYDQARDLAYLQFLAEAVKLSASYQFQGENFNRVRSNWRSEVSEVNVQTLGLSAQITTPSPVGTWTYGAEYYRDWVQSGQTTYNSNGTVNAVAVQGPVADDATYDLLGLYVQDQVPLPARWELTLGGRFTYARASADRVRDQVTGLETSLEDDWNSLVGSARLQWQMDRANHWRLFGGVSQGFRAPNLSDLTRYDINRSGEIETAAPVLKPENYVALEVGLKTQWEQFQGEVACFYTFIDNMIVRQPTGNMIGSDREVTKRNSGAGYVTGIEASGRWQFHPQLALFGWVTWMEGRVDGYPTSAPVLQREWLSRMMPMSGEVGLRWDAPNKKFWAEAVALLADQADRLSSGDVADNQRIPPGGTPGYAVCTLRGGWRIGEHATLTAAIENIGDAEYRVHGSGVNEPRRNFVIGADVRF